MSMAKLVVNLLRYNEQSKFIQYTTAYFANYEELLKQSNYKLHLTLI